MGSYRQQLDFFFSEQEICVTIHIIRLSIFFSDLARDFFSAFCVDVFFIIDILAGLSVLLEILKDCGLLKATN